MKEDKKVMYIERRNGTLEPVQFDKILRKLQSLSGARGEDASYPFHHLDCDYSVVAQHAIAGIYDGISTRQLDMLQADIAVGLLSQHPDYGWLGSRILMSRLHKETKKLTLMAFREMHKTGLLADDVYEVVKKNSKHFDTLLDHNRDFSYDFFAVKTLFSIYLTKFDGKVIERPQQMLLRIAIGLWKDNIPRVEETYLALSAQIYTHASPTIFNSGMNRPQLASCFEKGTMVTTVNRGPIPIEEVQIGDTVITHLGNVKPVVQVHANARNSRHMSELHIFKSQKVRVTNNHRLWAIRGSKHYSEAEWISVEELCVGDFVAVPRAEDRPPVESMDVADLLPLEKDKDASAQNNKMVHRSFSVGTAQVSTSTTWTHGNFGHTVQVARQGKDVPRFVDLSEDMCCFIGAFCGDGHIINRAGVVCGIAFTIDCRNAELIDFVKRVGATAFGMDSSIKKPQQNIMQVQFHSAIVGTMFKSLCGEGFAGKKIHPSLFQWNRPQVEAFIAGLVSTDGCLSKQGTVTIQMTNLDFMRSLYYLGRNVGIDVSYGLEHTHHRGTAPHVQMNIPRYPRLFEHLFKTYADRVECWRAKSQQRTSHGPVHIADGRQYLRLQAKVAIPEAQCPDVVYTLGVEGDHSYVVEGLVVENCFLLGAHDSVEGIMRSLSQAALVSKHAGGVGISWQDIRGSGAKIKGTNGTSSGIMPYLRILNDTMRAFNQGGRRAGSAAVYIEPSHPDILAFLHAKKPHGAEENRARDLFYALWIPDIFFKRVQARGVWSLFDPTACPGLSDSYGEEYERLYQRYEEEYKYTEQMPAVTLFEMIIRSMIEQGVPYLLSKDACNAKSNQKNLGTIKCSNLCVAGDTPILTSKGQLRIDTLVNKEVDVWNGQQFSTVTVRQTGKDQDMVRVSFSNGMTLDCTPYHRFKIHNGKEPYWTTAAELTKGMPLVRGMMPVIEGEQEWTGCPYTHGFFCGDGFLTNGSQPAAWLYGAKHQLQKHLDVASAGKFQESTRRSYVGLKRPMPPKFAVPVNCSVQIKLKWLAGWLDADGCSCQSKASSTKVVQASSVDLSFLQDVKLMLQTLGVDAAITSMHKAGRRALPNGKGGMSLYDCQASHRINISNTALSHLVRLGLETYRLDLAQGREPTVATARFVRVNAVEPLQERMDTFCFTEPKTNMGVFGGILCGQCAEIVEYSSPDEISVCTLASISLPAFVREDNGGPSFDFEALHKTTRLVTRNLNRVIDVGFLPLIEAQYSNNRNRPIGIGTQGLADLLAMMRLPFDHEKAMQLNIDIAETMYHASLQESIALAQEHGPYETFQGSPASQGLLQFDLWNTTPSDRYDWAALKQDIRTHGIRNSLLVAHMPTASTSQLLGNTESNEPFTSMIFLRKTSSGEHIVMNRHLVRDLMRLNLWSVQIKDSIVAHDGSVQHLRGQIPDELVDLYRTVWEIRQRTLIDMAAARGPFVCQSQSMNLFFESPTTDRMGSAVFHAWQSGLKTLVYYTRTKAAARAVSVAQRNRAYDTRSEPPDCLGCK